MTSNNGGNNEQENEDDLLKNDSPHRKEKKPFFLEKLPTSISEKSELRKYNQEKHLIRRPNTNFELNIPLSLKLDGIADINFQGNSLEDQLNAGNRVSQGEQFAPLGDLVSDDLNYEYQTPIDFLKSYNVISFIFFIFTYIILAEQTVD